MNIIETHLETAQFFRPRTLGMLDKVEQQSNPMEVLGWRPGPGRAHIAWQLMHIGVTEELFATERLAPHKAGSFQELWPRFRGGSKPDDNIPTPAEIRQVLTESHEHLAETLREIGDPRLDEIPPAFAERKLTHRDVLSLLLWHEAHHQGQAHFTLNSYLAGQ